MRLFLAISETLFTSERLHRHHVHVKSSSLTAKPEIYHQYNWLMDLNFYAFLCKKNMPNDYHELLFHFSPFLKNPTRSLSHKLSLVDNRRCINAIQRITYRI